MQPELSLRVMHISATAGVHITAALVCSCSCCYCRC
jgi:hypothetical protein